MPKLQEKVTEQLRALLPGDVELEVEGVPDWLRRPGRSELGDGWRLASDVYGDVTGLVLPEAAPLRERRRLDVLLTYPNGTRRVFEFDEAQHFTGPRARTLGFYDNRNVAFDVDDWRAQAVALTGREPGGGFARAKPPLFPDDGGRHQQRAFRDFLADYMPTLRETWLPTVRVHYKEVGAAFSSAEPGVEFAKLWNERTGESL